MISHIFVSFAWQMRKTTDLVVVILTHTSQDGGDCPKPVVGVTHYVTRSVSGQVLYWLQVNWQMSHTLETENVLDVDCCTGEKARVFSPRMEGNEDCEAQMSGFLALFGKWFLKISSLNWTEKKNKAQKLFNHFTLLIFYRVFTFIL